jgi:hypothetical protein
MQNLRPPTIADLYPQFTREELEEAEANFRQYLGVVLRMAERLRAEGKSINDLAVDCRFDYAADQLYHPDGPGCNEPE